MLEIFSSLNFSTLCILIILISLILFFEFINGFHDTANAIATVIYTNAMKPIYAVLISGLSNFLGVLAGGLAVAYSIVNLIPIDFLISTTNHNYTLTIFLFSILIGAIVWNFCTWYFGIPASSSHTLIGSIIGVGCAYAILNKDSIVHGVNWGKALDICLSLLFSPLMGFILAYLLVVALKQLLPRANIHNTPNLNSTGTRIKHPPFWTRFLLILSSIGVSFAHGSNDGQKGVGLFVLVLLCIAPNYFLLNLNISHYTLEKTIFAGTQLNHFMTERKDLSSNISYSKACTNNDINIINENINEILIKRKNVKKMTVEEKQIFKNSIMCYININQQLLKNKNLTKNEIEYLQLINSDLKHSIEYAPIWVLLAIALSLGLGTLIGWRRVVRTVGEGISKTGMTYAQGVSSQLTTAFSIACANIFGLPVSTTQILSSAVAGSAIANKAKLNKITIRNIILTWVLTLPIAIIISGVVFFIVKKLFDIILNFL